MNLSTLFAQIDPKTVIVTPNRRLSAWLTREYDQFFAKKAALSWKTPPILPYETWLNWHYQQALDTGNCQKLLLTDKQSDLIWQRIIKTSPVADTLLQTQQTARLASAAFKAIQQWLLPLDHPAFQESVDYQTFQVLAERYLEYLETKQYIDHSQVYLALEKIILVKTDSIAFLGFAELTAEQQRLTQSLKAQRKTVIIDPLYHVDHPRIEKIDFKHLNEELSNVAHFCKRSLQEYPSQTIGCVIPNLAQLRDKVESIFNKIIPGTFNISAAKPLTSYPMIYTALSCLSLNKIDLERETLSHLLKTPFIGFAETELSARMQLDAFLSEHNIHNVSFNFLKQLTETTTPLFYQLFSKFEAQQKKQSLSQWAKSFDQQLQTIGWPGERTLNSLEFQTVQRFYKVLDELSALELIQPACYFREAFALLSQLCQQALFQGETTPQPIQILGNLEAGGLYFDKLWISGLNDQDWPALNAPNPFIPLRLQREHALPHANANRTLAFYQLLSMQLFHASEIIIVSYARQIEGIDYQASEFIRPFPNATLSSQYEEPTIIPLPYEEYPPTGVALKDLTIKGGTAYFKSQSACPFQAYALFRLHAKSIPDTHFGLDAIERGVVIHKALELIWKTLQSSETLSSKTERELQEIIQQAILQALEKIKLSKTLQHLETLRLNDLLYDWLMLEKTRGHFIIKSLEKNQSTTINQLHFTTRADRIDELSNGSHLVIDYKTKKVAVNDWLTDRMVEPQLPIYALTDAHVSNIAFAQVRRDELKLSTLDNIDWPEQKEIWLQQLNKLADEITSGLASVTPRNIACCQQCDLHSLCRIHEVSHHE